MNEFKRHNTLLPHLFRQEYAKMTAVLCRHFGLKQIEIAEDIASDTFLKASEHWAINGIPENPTAWLYAVAKNNTKDYFKRMAIFETKIKGLIKQDEIEAVKNLETDSQIITDSQLAMIFAVCIPSISGEAQVCLALQVLCGFGVDEIANAFLTNKETIKKRLYRARSCLRKSNFQIKPLNGTDVKQRLDSVLKTLYLLFNEGYFSKTNNHLVRKDLCSEAIRLTLMLIENTLTNIPKVNALLALMCFQTSRLDARVNVYGEATLFDKQNRALWDQSLIDRGNYYLVNACSGTEISKYHLEAGIAYWHTTPTDTNKWEHILTLYDQLCLIEDSPIIILNRAFAFSKIHGNKNAIKEMESLNMPKNSFYHALLGYLYADTIPQTAIKHYTKARDLTTSKVEKQTLTNEIERLLFIINERPPTGMI